MGEVVRTRTRPLPVEAHQAAVLDAHGTPRQDIVRITGATASAIKQWRQTLEYQQLVEGIQNRGVTELAGLFAEVRQEVITAFRKATAEAVAMLGACDDHGEPLYSVRARAIEAITAQTRLILPGATRDDGGGSTAAATAAVVIIKGDGEIIEGAAKDIM